MLKPTSQCREALGSEKKEVIFRMKRKSEESLEDTEGKHLQPSEPVQALCGPRDSVIWAQLVEAERECQPSSSLGREETGLSSAHTGPGGRDCRHPSALALVTSCVTFGPQTSISPSGLG